MPKQKPHLNAADIKLLEQLFATKAEVEGFQKLFVTQQDQENFEQKVLDRLGRMPTKDEFFRKMDEVVGELAKMREENAILGGKVYDHEDRISALEVSV